MGERAPQHIQNIVIRDYCKKNNFNFLLSATEYAMDDSYLILDQLIQEVSTNALISGIIAYSIFQLPNDYKLRLEYIDKIIKMDKEWYFAVEQISIIKKSDIERVENIMQVNDVLIKTSNKISNFFIS